MTPVGELIIFGAAEIRDERRKRLSLIDLETGKDRTVSMLGPLSGVHVMAFSPDGATLTLSSSEDRLIRLWHRRPPPRTTALRGHAPKEAWTVAFAPNGRALASGGDDGVIRLWDPATGRETASLQGHRALVTSVAFAPDGRSLASGSFDDQNYAMLWDVASGRRRSEFRGHEGHVRGVAFASDGRALVSVSDDCTIGL